MKEVCLNVRRMKEGIRMEVQKRKKIWEGKEEEVLNPPIRDPT